MNLIITRLKAYYELTKPKTVWLLVFVGACAPFLSHPNFNTRFWIDYFLGNLSLLLAVAGTNAFTCWIDRDIDALMERTRERPIPKGEISPRAGLLFSISTFLLGVLIAIFYRPSSALYLILGFLFSAVIYNGYLKRRSFLNVVIASPAGMMPVLFMWTFTGNKIGLVPILMGLLVIFWTPAHIWSLAILYKRDYKKAGVPMLPVVEGEATTVRSIALANFFLLLTSVALSFFGKFSGFFLFFSLALNIILFYLTLRAGFNPTKKAAFELFKFSSPYLAAIYLFAVIDRILFA